MNTRPHVTLAIATALSLQAPALAAEREQATLAYSADSRCPDRAAFRSLVSSRLGYDPFATESSSIAHSVRITIQSKGNALRGTVEVQRAGQSKPGVREISSDECDSLATTLATGVAIALDPVHALDEKPPPEKPKVVEPTPPPEPPLAPEKTVPVSEPADWIASVAMVGGVGLTPGIAIGAEGTVGLRFRYLSVSAGFRGVTNVGASRADSGDRLDANLLAGEVIPCAHVGIASACGLSQLGTFQGRAPDVISPSQRSSLFVALGARIGMEIPLGRTFSLGAGLEALVPLTRTTLVVNQVEVWKTPQVAGSTLLSFNGRFR